METKEMKGRRKIVLINRAFQFRMIAVFIILNALIMVVFGGIMFLFLDSKIEASMHSASVTYTNLRQMLFPILLRLSIINVIISSIAIWAFILFASHKLAGPIYRFTVALEEMCNNNFTPYMGVREGDQFVVFSRTLKQMTETVRIGLTEIREKAAQIQSLAARDDRAALQSAVTELNEMMKKYKLQ